MSTTAKPVSGKEIRKAPGHPPHGSRRLNRTRISGPDREAAVGDDQRDAEGHQDLGEGPAVKPTQQQPLDQATKQGDGEAA